jgi:hypothetical protein
MESNNLTAAETPYPVQFSVEYPDRELNRLTTGFRLIVAFPILIVAAALGGHEWGSHGSGPEIAAGTGALLVLAPLFMIVFRQKYPRWWYDWNVELLRFSNRIGAYLALMDDRYPSTDEQQAVRLDLPFPDAKEGLNRWLPLVKWLLAIPHYILLVFLSIAAVVAVVIAWFAILFTGRYPRGLFDFVLGVLRWGNRVIAYAFVLVTDQYPPLPAEPVTRGASRRAESFPARRCSGAPRPPTRRPPDSTPPRRTGEAPHSPARRLVVEPRRRRSPRQPRLRRR